LRRWKTRDRARQGTGDDAHRAENAADARQTEQAAASERRLRLALIAVERRALIALRDRDRIGDDVLRRVQRDLDLETMLLEASADSAPDSPYEDV
jgi:hypothetical protein